jgi:putative DNA methylase
MIERDFDIAFIADLALREKQIQQNYRPIIAVHKWFARRPGTLFRGLLLAEFSGISLGESFYQSCSLKGLRIGDPFMGGGIPLLEANRVGCDVIGCDINPMAYWIVKEELDHIDLGEYRRASRILRTQLEKDVGHLYRTKCLCCGTPAAHVKYFLWVKIQSCHVCGQEVDLFPGYLVSENTRHPKNVFVCGVCGELTETADRKEPGNCCNCGTPLSLVGPAKRNSCECPQCRARLKFPDVKQGPPRHRMFAIEYYCPSCKGEHKGRFFKKPDAYDLNRVAAAEELFATVSQRFIPTEEIPTGDESDRLHRWGYRRYSQMFNARQLLGLALSCELITKQTSERIRHALATNLSDLLRYQNMLCRYDTMALKSLDVFSVHGFPVGLIQCESNLLGISNDGKELSIGSGGWTNIIDKYAKAKAYCDDPFEVRHHERGKTKVYMPTEWIGESRNGVYTPESRKIELRCQDAAQTKLQPESLDAVLTDPPYYGNVQYAELMDFCFVWLRRLASVGNQCFDEISTRNGAELTGNVNMNRGAEHFTEGLSQVFQNMAEALKSGAPLAFTYHHNQLEAYHPIAVAILDSRLVCTATLPCPAEMGASIHISGTGSSIVDTVFVCRKLKCLPEPQLESPSLTVLLEADRQALSRGGVKVNTGDLRCISYGHLIRLAVQHLAKDWNPTSPTKRKLERVDQLLRTFEPSIPVRQHKSELRTRSGDLLEGLEAQLQI